MVPKSFSFKSDKDITLARFARGKLRGGGRDAGGSEDGETGRRTDRGTRTRTQREGERRGEISTSFYKIYTSYEMRAAVARDMNKDVSPMHLLCTRARTTRYVNTPILLGNTGRTKNKKAGEN